MGNKRDRATPRTFDDSEVVQAPPTAEVADVLKALLQRPTAKPQTLPLLGVLVGELVAMADAGQTPLVLYPGQPGTAALRARSVVDLHGTSIGKPVVLSFENGDPTLPIVMGVVRDESSGAPMPDGQVEFDHDGARMIVAARQQLVLRCGKASITLTKEGKVLIEGNYILSKSAGANRIKGGSVQLN